MHSLQDHPDLPGVLVSHERLLEGLRCHAHDLDRILLRPVTRIVNIMRNGFRHGRLLV